MALYESLLGEAFGSLDLNVRRAHVAPLIASGTLDVEHGSHWVVPLLWILAALLLGETCITLWDFIEEDKIRRLPPGERAMHAIMGIVYGAFLAYLIPHLVRWSRLDSGWGASHHGFPAWVLLVIAAGVFVSGIRDLIASARRRPA